MQPSKKRPNFRKRRINKPSWIVNKRKKTHESGQEHVNNKGKLIPATKILSKKDCAVKRKFNSTKKIDTETQESIVLALYRLDTNGQYSFIAQATICFSVAETKEGHKKSGYIFLNERRRLISSM